METTLWRHRDFVRLWTAQTISVFGSQFTSLALPLVAVVMLSALPAEMGVLSAARTAPFLLIGLVAGVCVDRRRRRPVLIVGDLGRALLLSLIPLGAYVGVLRMPLLYAIGLLVGVFTVFFGDLGLTPAAIGLIFSTGSGGGLVGAFVASLLARRLGVSRVIIGSAFLSGLALVPIAFARSSFALPLLIAAGFLQSLSVPVYDINQVSLRQAIGVAALAGILSFLWVWRSPVRTLQRIPEPMGTS